jgi:hypothetical protein
MEFSTDGTTAINEVSSDETAVFDVNSIITDANSVIYDMQGRMMPQGAALPRGMYIVKNNNRTIKVRIN